MAEPAITRRSLITGGLAGVTGMVGAGYLVEQGVLPGRAKAYSTLGLNGEGAPIPDVEPGELISGTFVSAARGGVEVGWSVGYPPSHGTDAELPVWLVLHGASNDHDAVFERLALDRFLALAVADGVPPLAVAAADGGPTFWRPQPDGTDSSRMLTDEFLPMLAARGLVVDRLALGGWSMGGYGALRLACTERVPLRAVAVMSPALPGPGVDADELADVPVRIDCGRGDQFYRAVTDFVDELDPTPPHSFEAGGHTPDYWRTVAPEQLRFVAEHLA